MNILGLVFAGTATDQRSAMTLFLQDTLGLTRATAGQPHTDFFDLPDGTHFAVTDEREVGAGTSRTIGFLVADVDQAVAELRVAGVSVDDPTATDRQRYAHFIAPDGELYELVQNR